MTDRPRSLRESLPWVIGINKEVHLAKGRGSLLLIWRNGQTEQQPSAMTAEAQDTCETHSVS